MFRFRPLALTLVAAFALAACDAATETESAAADAPLGGPSLTAPAVLTPERALDAATLARTILSDQPLDAALKGAGATFQFRNRGAVMTLSDAAGPNEVILFMRDKEGQISPFGTYPTQGTGSGGGLGAATDPLVVSPDGRYLYAINRGSDDISVFRILGNGLEFREIVPSGGAAPMSLAVSETLVYVLHTGRDGTPGNVVAFERRKNGSLRAMEGGTAALPAGVAGPPQIGFDPAAQTAVLTDRPSDTIVTYPIEADGTPGTPVVTSSTGATPFGFDFDTAGRLFVSNANAPGGMPVADGSSVTSYGLSGTALSLIDGPVGTTETAACWTRILGDYLYVTNTASGTISGYQIQSDGSLTLLDADGVTATTAPNPRDMNIALRYLYAQGDGQIDAFRIGDDGSLTPIGSVSVPATARGVATR